MPRQLKLYTAAALAALVLAISVIPATTQRVIAQGYSDGEDVYRENTDISRIFNKLGRGVINLLTGWVEIPKQVAKEWRRTDPFTGTVLGLCKGLVWGLARTFAGFYEIISFPFPVPRNYEPIIDPEYVLPTVWGERLPLFRDEFVGLNSSVDSAIDYGSANNNAPAISQSPDTIAAGDRSTRNY